MDIKLVNAHSSFVAGDLLDKYEWKNFYFDLIGNLLYSEDTIATATDKAKKKSFPDCPASYVTQIAGHKSVNSLASHSACDIVQRKMARTVTENVDFSTHAACQAVPDSDVTGDAGGAVSPARPQARQIYRNSVIVSRSAEFHNCT